MPTNETLDPTMNATRSLSFYVTVWLAVAIAVSMAAYAFYQYFIMPGMTATELFLHHLWHVLGLGAVIYVLCWLVFDRVLLRPLKQIYVHLYALGAGKLEPLELASNVAEIRTIVEGINLMIFKLKQGADGNSLELAQQRIGEIRAITKGLTAADSDAISVVLEKLTELQSSLAVVVQRRHGPGVKGVGDDCCGHHQAGEESSASAGPEPARQNF